MLKIKIWKRFNDLQRSIFQAKTFKIPKVKIPTAELEKLNFEGHKVIDKIGLEPLSSNETFQILIFGVEISFFEF